MKVYSNEELIKERQQAATKAVMAVVFGGDRKANTSGSEQPLKVFSASKETLEASREVRMMALEGLRQKVVGDYKSLDELKAVTMQANSPTAAVLEEFFGKFYIEVQRQALEAPDLTSMIAAEQTNYDFPEIVDLRNLLPFRGQMLQVSGGNDPVPLIEQATGALIPVTMKAWAIGWKDTLWNMLFNKFFTMAKVVDAAVSAYTDNRNKLTVGVIVGATYVASQSQAADTTANMTLDERTYKTFQSAVKLIQNLKDPQTNRKIGKRPLSVLANSADSWQIERVLRGQLEANGGGARGNVVSALPIGSILEYDQGINDGFTVGKTTLSFPGVVAGTCYLFVPGVAIVANKRPLTMESGIGSALQLSTEERAWYHVQGEYFGDFLGSSAATPVGGAAGYGFIVKISLPTS